MHVDSEIFKFSFGWVAREVGWKMLALHSMTPVHECPVSGVRMWQAGMHEVSVLVEFFFCIWHIELYIINLYKILYMYVYRLIIRKLLNKKILIIFIYWRHNYTLESFWGHSNYKFRFAVKFCNRLRLIKITVCCTK